MKRVKFLTLGCKVNQYETQLLREQFLEAGLLELENSHPADFYVINTCTVTERADKESLNLIRRAKRENPRAEIIVTGCLTELDADKIRNIGGRRLIVKNKDKENISKRLSGSKRSGVEGISYFKGHTRAFLKIQDGCNNSCSYCKVPLVRGKSQSRALAALLKDARRLVENGYKEIVLSGICLGAYGRDLRPRVSILEVLEVLKDLKGLLRIRLSSIEARDTSDDLINKIAGSKKICRHLHIPIQSGDDQILRRMNRHYTRSQYLELIRKIKRRIPQTAITTDMMVGFPGEEEANFINTMDLIKEILPLKVHIFPYSARVGTFAYKNFRERVDPLTIKTRISRLKNLADNCSLKYKRQFLGKEMEVLIEGEDTEGSSCWQGHTDNYIKVEVRSRQDLRNRLVPLRLKEIKNNSLLAYSADIH